MLVVKLKIKFFKKKLCNRLHYFKIYLNSTTNRGLANCFDENKLAIMLLRIHTASGYSSNYSLYFVKFYSSFLFGVNNTLWNDGSFSIQRDSTKLFIT